jgi:hypothetical protein
MLDKLSVSNLYLVVLFTKPKTYQHPLIAMEKGNSSNIYSMPKILSINVCISEQVEQKLISCL